MCYYTAHGDMLLHETSFIGTKTFSGMLILNSQFQWHQCMLKFAGASLCQPILNS